MTQHPKKKKNDTTSTTPPFTCHPFSLTARQRHPWSHVRCECAGQESNWGWLLGNLHWAGRAEDTRMCVPLLRDRGEPGGWEEQSSLRRELNCPVWIVRSTTASWASQCLYPYIPNLTKVKWPLASIAHRIKSKCWDQLEKCYLPLCPQVFCDPGPIRIIGILFFGTFLMPCLCWSCSLQLCCIFNL